MIACAGVMAVPYGVLLLGLRRTHARSHVEHDTSRWATAVHKVNPLAGQVGKSREVCRCREPLRLEASHLARRGCVTLIRLATDDPAHGRIMAQTFGVVHALISIPTSIPRIPH